MYAIWMGGQRAVNDNKKDYPETFLTATTMLPLYPSECRMPVFQVLWYGAPSEGW